MINTTTKARAKGYRTVAKIRKILTDDGFIVANLEKTGKFVQEKDLFGKWDLLALRGKEHLFIQAKTNLETGKTKLRKWTKTYMDFGREHRSKYVRYELWVWFDRKSFTIIECK